MGWFKKKPATEEQIQNALIKTNEDLGKFESHLKGVNEVQVNYKKTLNVSHYEKITHAINLISSSLGKLGKLNDILERNPNEHKVKRAISVIKHNIKILSHAILNLDIGVKHTVFAKDIDELDWDLSEIKKGEKKLIHKVKIK